MDRVERKAGDSKIELTLESRIILENYKTTNGITPAKVLILVTPPENNGSKPGWIMLAVHFITWKASMK